MPCARCLNHDTKAAAAAAVASWALDAGEVAALHATDRVQRGLRPLWAANEPQLCGRMQRSGCAVAPPLLLPRWQLLPACATRPLVAGKAFMRLYSGVQDGACALGPAGGLRNATCYGTAVQMRLILARLQKNLNG